MNDKEKLEKLSLKKLQNIVSRVKKEFQKDWNLLDKRVSSVGLEYINSIEDLQDKEKLIYNILLLKGYIDSIINLQMAMNIDFETLKLGNEMYMCLELSKMLTGSLPSDLKKQYTVKSSD